MLVGYLIGNLMLVGLFEVLVDLVVVFDEFGCIFGVKGRVLLMCLVVF